MKRSLHWILAVVFAGCQLLADAQNDSIPFLYRGHLYVQATINDTVDLDIVFDTGAADIFGVDSVWLNNGQWIPQHVGNAQVGGGAGATIVPLILDRTKVKIGSVEEQYPYVPVFKLRDVVDCHIDGIWGIKNIAECPLEINFENGYLKWHRSGLPNTDGYKRLPIQYEDDRIKIWVGTLVGGTEIKGWYLMDTGSGTSVDFTAQTTQDFRLDTVSGKRHLLDVNQLGLGDRKQEVVVNMMSEWIGLGTGFENDTIFGESISYIPEGTGAFSDRSYLGVIGNAIWSKYNLIIDAKRNVLYLRRFEPDSAPQPTFDYSFRNRTDIGAGWLVSALYRDGDAADAGMALGDTIKAVNGRPVADYSWEEEYNLFDAPRMVLDIVGANGEEKRIELEAKKMW